MLDTLRRMWFGATPFDRTMLVIELLVLLLIAYEIVAPRFHQWNIRRRMKRAVTLLAKGQDIQQNWPPETRLLDDPTAKRLLKSATDWIDETREFLRKYSVQAARSFEHNPTGIRRQMKATGYVTSAAYVDLTGRLNRLQAIIDSADRYF